MMRTSVLGLPIVLPTRVSANVRWINYINPGYGLSLVDTLWNASSYRQPLEQEGDPMTWIEKFRLQISLIVAKK